MILDRFKLTDRVAIITGAGKGIGRGIALAFAEAGADIVCAARTEADIEATANDVRERGRRALAVPTDVLETSHLERLVEATLKEFGRVDVLVNNAGGSPPRAALDTSEKFFERALRMNVTQAFLLSRLCVPKMVETASAFQRWSRRRAGARSSTSRRARATWCRPLSWPTRRAKQRST